MNSTQQLGFVGLGVMGEPICRNMTRSGQGQMTVFDLNPAPVERLVKTGAQAAASVADVAHRSDILFLSLPGGNEVEQTIMAKDGVLTHGRPGLTVVDMSTCPVATARKLASALGEKGMHFADAPVARTRQAAEDGTLSIMVGGDAQTFGRIRPLLAAAATDITHCGEVGTGQVVKLVNNMLLIQSVVALAEAMTIGERAGVDRQVLADTLSKGSADSFALRNHGMKSIVPRDFPTGAFGAEYALKDISYALELAENFDVLSGSGMIAKTMLERACTAGFGKQYFPVLTKLIEEDRT